MANHLLKDVKEDQAFFLADGTTLKNIKDLLDAVRTMDENTFLHHVNDKKHDFHNWVNEVHQDKQLADSLFKARNQQTVHKAIHRRILALKKSTKQNSSKNVVKKANQINQTQNKFENHNQNLMQSSKQNLKQSSKQNQIESQNNILNFNFKNKKNQIAFEVPAPPEPQRHKKHEAAAVSIAAVLIVMLFALISKAGSITGSVVAHGYVPGDFQFVGLGGIGGVLVLLFVTLQVIKRRNSPPMLEL